MKKIFVLFGILFLCVGSADEIRCSDSYLDNEKIFDLRTKLLANNKLAIQNIVHPFKVQVAGAVDSYSDILMEVIWDDVFTPKVKNKLKKASLCELVKYLGIIEVDGQYKATQLVFNFDKEDLKFSHSSISSAKELRAFIIKMNKLAKQSPKKLGDYIFYPFAIPRNGSTLTIDNKAEFIENVAVIVNNEFIKTLERGLDESNFRFHYIGIMLDDIGSIWVAEARDGELGLMMYGSHVNP